MKRHAQHRGFCTVTMGFSNRRFYATFAPPLTGKAGLTADEAEEVVQETAIGVARGLPEFVYDPKVCRFKTWLLNLTRWRIQNQLRKRPRTGGVASQPPPIPNPSPMVTSNDTARTSTIERIPDPAMPEFGAEWDSAWEKNLLTQALERVKARIEERQFQVFDLCVSKGWPAADVAQTLGISVARVYLTRHRISALVKKEVERLQRAIERSLQTKLPAR